MGHSVRCKAQQVRIKEMMGLLKGDTVTIIIDYMMKWEEERARESTREHYGKRGIVVHGSLLKYEKTDGTAYKKVYLTVPEGDGTQDAKAALASVDVICKAVKDDQVLDKVKKIILVSDNAGTYSADVFHIAVFDVVRSHGFEVRGILHNESQRSSFYVGLTESQDI